MVYLSRPYYFKFFKGCLPQILLSPLLNNLSYMLNKYRNKCQLSNAQFKYIEESKFHFALSRHPNPHHIHTHIHDHTQYLRAENPI